MTRQQISPARKRVNELKDKVHKYHDFRVIQHPFLQELEKGTLTLKQLETYAVNQYVFTVDIIADFLSLIHRFSEFFQTHPQIWDSFVEKLVVEELTAPRVGGHSLLAMRFAKALGLSDSDLVGAKLGVEARAAMDFFARIVKKATLPELIATSFGEGEFSEFSLKIYEGLRRNYGFKDEDLEFFILHGEVDIEHGQANMDSLERIIVEGLAEETPGWGFEYLALMNIESVGLLLDGAYNRHDA